jgi:hypothetical protein
VSKEIKLNIGKDGLALLYCLNCRIGYDKNGIAFRQCSKCRKKERKRTASQEEVK